MSIAAIFDTYMRPALDVLLIATVIYHTYRLLVKTRVLQLIRGVLWLGIVYGLAFLLQLETLLWIMNRLAPSFLIAMAIIFQPEIRQIINRLGRRTVFTFGSVREVKEYPIEPVITAVKQLVEMRRGALIVFTRRIGLLNIIDSGTKLYAEVSSQLLMTIFAYNTTLHDGAVVISDDRVVAAGCLLPLSTQTDAVANYGTRHRAGLGIAEESDAIALIISEETGTLSLAYDGRLHNVLTLDAMQQRLHGLLVDGREAGSGAGVTEGGMAR